MTEDRITSEYFDTDQRILFYVLRKGSSVTIEEVSEEMDIPRSTASDHLNTLSKDGFLTVEKDGRTKKFSPDPDIANEMLDSLSRLQSSYIYALRQIKSKELEELEGVNGENNGNSDS